MNGYYPEFLTATIYKWKHLLAEDRFKLVIVNTLKWLVEHDRCVVYAFVIMPNHIHMIWKIAEEFERHKVQGALLSFSAHQFKKYLNNDRKALSKHFVIAEDRRYQFWQSHCMVKECWSDHFTYQKLNYIHNNPLQQHWKLSEIPEDYEWSSADFYVNGADRYPWLTRLDA